ncbi:MAG: hypothetical protein IJM17_01595 [Firmicutes bacterium]|nr:hypothetical protein [Bacillota bacterium]
MELQIQDLVSSIKKDGIEAANKEAEAIIAEAKKQAASILSDARSEADKIKENAEKEVEVYKNSARLSAEQAKRDAGLAFKNEVENEFKKLLSAKVGEALNDKALPTLIAAALNGEDPSGYAVELGQVSEALKSGLAEKLGAGLEIRPSKAVKTGFRLAAKDGSGFFDCSDEEITQMLMPFLRDIKL